MLDELLKNTEKYFWTTNKDGDIVLGNSDLGLKAKVTFTVTKKWINLAPIVESNPGQFIGKPRTFLKKTKEYKQVSELYKLVKTYLKEVSLSDRGKLSKNTFKLIQNYYKE